MNVVLHTTNAGHAAQQWEFVVCHFKPDAIFIVDDSDDLGCELNSGFEAATHIQTAAELPAEMPLVVLSPANGANVKGTVSLADFVHPANAVYWFGSDNRHLESELFAARQPDHIVYIPTDTIDQMYSHSAFVATAWDLRMKSA